MARQHKNTLPAKEIIKTSWDLSPLASSDDDPAFGEKRKKILEVNTAFITKWKERNDYLEDPDMLREALDELEKIEHTDGLMGDEGYYFALRSELDETDPHIKAKLNKIADFGRKIINDRRFFEHRLAKVSSEVQKRFLDSEELGPYRHYLEQVFAESKYLLSEPEEKILTLKANVSEGAWEKMMSGFLSQSERTVESEHGKQEMKTFSQILDLLNSSDKKIRDDAARAFNEILDQYKEVAEAEMNAILENKKVDDELRGVDRPDVLRHVADDIETEVVDTMLDVVRSRFDLSVRYYALKAKLMGVERLSYHERNVPFGAIEKSYTFDEAAALVTKVFHRLDPEFATIFQSFLQKGQIDVFPKKGKRSGAFCTHALLSEPTYVLLNFTNNLRDVETIAHEMGHAINNELIRKRQHALYFETPTSTAEVASTFMEDFVGEDLLQEADDSLRLSLLMNKLNEDIATIFRQVACYSFEQELHQSFREKGYLSYQEIGEIFQKHMSAYMGDAVEQSEGSQNWWIYWSHIRMLFYVYSYASGLLISKSLQASVRRDHAFIEKVKNFLCAGASASPKEIFAAMSVDITDRKFWENGLDEVERLLDETEALAKKLGKLT